MEINEEPTEPSTTYKEHCHRPPEESSIAPSGPLGNMLPVSRMLVYLPSIPVSSSRYMVRFQFLRASKMRHEQVTYLCALSGRI